MCIRFGVGRLMVITVGMVHQVRRSLVSLYCFSRLDFKVAFKLESGSLGREALVKAAEVLPSFEGTPSWQVSGPTRALLIHTF